MTILGIYWKYVNFRPILRDIASDFAAIRLNCYGIRPIFGAILTPKIEKSGQKLFFFRAKKLRSYGPEWARKDEFWSLEKILGVAVKTRGYYWSKIGLLNSPKMAEKPCFAKKWSVKLL